MADAILVTTRLMCQVPRPAQLEPVFLLIQQQQTRKLRERVVKGRCQLRRRFRKPLKRHVQRYFFVPRIHKRLDLQRWSRQRARSRHILQFQERPGQQRRKHGAKETPPGGLARGHFSGDRTRQAKLSAFPEVRRVPLSTYFRRRAAEVEERNFARDTLAPRRHSLGWPDSRARGGAVWLPQSRAMG